MNQQSNLEKTKEKKEKLDWWRKKVFKKSEKSMLQLKDGTKRS